MSTRTSPAPPPAPAGDRSRPTTTVNRLRALGQAEMTLLLRNRTALFTVLFMPALMVAVFRSVSDNLDLEGTGLTINETIMTGGIGMVLLMVVYSNGIAGYVARREERVLKRLRTGEPTDREILTGTALPSIVAGLAQCVLLVVAGVALLDLSAPSRPDLLLAGVALGTAMMVLMAAVTAAFTRTPESAQLTAMPVFLVSVIGSGVFVPFEAMPDTMADVCRLLPLSPVMELVRNGWLGGMAATDTLRALALAAAWTALAGYGVRRWFRWEARQ